MLSFEHAFEIMIKHAATLGTETASLFEAAGRILAVDIRSDTDMPPFNKSAMDGYACRRQDLGGILRIVEDIPAGKTPEKKIGKNECSRIMTGAKIPEGADCVVMKEYTNNPENHTMQFTGNETENNICYKGEDIKKGDLVLRKGIIIKSQDIAVLATAGCANPLVYTRPRVGIMATGDELVEPDKKPVETKIRNSNSYQIFSQVKGIGAVPLYFGVANDARESLDEKIKKARPDCDVLIFSGGVSMGDYDLVPDVLRENGFEIIFHKVGIKPGRPALFCVSKNVFCFGLPGNPVSTFVTFEIFVKPFLYKMMGHDFAPRIVPMILEETIKRKKTERRSFLPVKRTLQGGVVPVDYHGSAHMNSLCEAEGIVTVPEGIAEIPKGKMIDVRQI